MHNSFQYTTPRTDHDLDDQDPNLPLWDIVRDLYSTDPAQETRAVDHAGCAASTEHYELQ